jgi:hypothetical protein
MKAIATPLALAAAALLAFGAPQADAKPVITGFSATPERGAPACGGASDCLRFTFRAFDASRARDAKLTFRLVVWRSDGTREFNLTGRFANTEATQRYWTTPKRPFVEGTYRARVIVTGADSTKSPLTTFRWSE